MKIGLLTYHKNNNYGWNLQCYALMTILKSLGHEVILIDKRKFKKRNLVSILKILCKKIFGKFLRLKDDLYEIEEIEKGKIVNTFFEKYLSPRTQVILNKKHYKSLPRFDALVVGSDQVWRPKLVCPICDYFFDFIDYDVTTISYASSFGVDYCEYSNEEIIRCKKLIEKFKAVSVRESSAIELIYDVFKWNCNPVLVPDPTLLLNKEQYMSIVSNYGELKKKEGLFYYILDYNKEKDDIINLLVQKMSLKKYTLNMIDGKYLPPVEDWLHGFACADFIFTDSFHGCVFALIFRKPFIAIGNIKRGLSRFVSLLKQFDQSHRLILSIDDLNNTDFSKYKQLNCDIIDNIQNQVKAEGLHFISKNLSNNSKNLNNND